MIILIVIIIILQELIRAKSSLREPLVAENCAFSLQEVLKVNRILHDCLQQ